MLSIISWNVNGLRAVHRKGHFKEVLKEDPDILCVQETKSLPDQLPEEFKAPNGYESYFHFPTQKKGYSGVAIYTKINPIKVSRDIGIKEMDQEGRIIVAEYPDLPTGQAGFTLINCYFPNGGGPPERLRYKLDFYDYFLEFLNKLHAKPARTNLSGWQPNILICGDFNVAHKAIDLARPKENANHIGFLPIERAWMDKFVSDKWIDVFRHFYPDKKDIYTYWDMKSFARERNEGWRIDYFFSSPEMIGKIKSIEIMDNIYGSDHCPIKIVL